MELYEMRPDYQRVGLEQLCQKLKENTIMIEIGSFAGESTAIFLNSGKVDKIYCVDPWTYGYDDEDIASRQNEDAEKVFDGKFDDDDRVIKIKEYSDLALSQLTEKVDFVYVDGNHTNEWVKKDIANYIPLIKDDGFIGGHDCTHPPIADAIRESNIFRYDSFMDSSWITPVSSVGVISF